MRGTAVLSVIASVIAAAGAAEPPSQLSDDSRPRGVEMLREIQRDIEKHYYDPTFRGVDLPKLFGAAKEKVQSARSDSQVIGIVARTLTDLNDSHTFLIPPPLAVRVDYGWTMRMVADQCYVIGVDAKRDAAAKGLKPGDVIELVDGVAPDRETFWKIRYYHLYRPQPAVRLVVRPPQGPPREMEVRTHVEKRELAFSMEDLVAQSEEDEARFQRDTKPRYHLHGRDMMMVRMPSFEVDDAAIDGIMKTARDHKGLILDLRGNAGGFVDAMRRLAGHFFDRNVKIGDLLQRKGARAVHADTRGPGRTFNGRVVVLVDSGSASASEILARLMQIEKRGTVLGDRTAGAVMQSRLYPHRGGAYRPFFFGASITEADIVMGDGRSLERSGVVPNEQVLPTGADLRARKDPVLSRAAELLGVTLSPEQAGATSPPTDR